MGKPVAHYGGQVALGGECYQHGKEPLMSQPRSFILDGYRKAFLVFLTAGLLAFPAACDSGGDGAGGDSSGDSDGNGGGTPVDLAYAKLLIEHNATDEDTGFQIATDGDAWNDLIITGPDGNAILSVSTVGAMRNVGLTEMFFETQEPENAVAPIDEWIANLPEGTYSFSGTDVEGTTTQGEATLTHDTPAGPVITAPEEDAVVSADEDLTISWDPVAVTIDDVEVNVTHYQLIVEEDVESEHQGFGKTIYSVTVPSTVTSMRVPSEFLAAGTAYAFEVLAIEESGNQTLSSSAFETE